MAHSQGVKFADRLVIAAVQCLTVVLRRYRSTGARNPVQVRISLFFEFNLPLFPKMAKITGRNFQKLHRILASNPRALW